MTSSYPFVATTPSNGFSNPRNIARLDSLPIPDACLKNPPSLPSAPRNPDFYPGYAVTTHIIPGAFPRYSYQVASKHAATFAPILNNPPSSEASKSERALWMTKKVDEMREKIGPLETLRLNNYPTTKSSTGDDGPAMWIVVNRYARVVDKELWRNRQKLTIVSCHPLGLHKETYEPTLKHLIDLTDSPECPFIIDDLWSIDMANSGDSAMLNRENLGCFFDFLDNARDLLNLIENYIPEGSHDPSAKALPVHLSPINSAVSKRRAAEGLLAEGRFTVGLCQSVGGSSIVEVAYARPNIFRSLTLVDPVVLALPETPIPSPDYGMMMSHGYKLVAVSALGRRSRWPSREEAMQTLERAAPIFSAWDRAALESYVQYALYDAPDGSVALKMEPFDEAISFSDRTTISEVWDIIPKLDENIHLHWIMPGAKPFLGTHEAMRLVVWRRPINAQNTIIQKRGHLLVQEVPKLLAREVMKGWMHMEINRRNAKPPQSKL